MTTYTTLSTAYPEFVTTDDDEQTAIGEWCELADLLVRTGSFRTTAMTTRARLLLAAHLVALHQRERHHLGGGVGAITSVQLKGKVESFDVPETQLDEALLRGTHYGLAFIQMRRASLARLPFTL